MKSEMIAPCGMNCRLCRAYQRKRNKCHGCNSDTSNISPHCNTCKIKNCEALSDHGSKFCFACDSYPCVKIKNLDKRYRLKYGMSMIQNLDTINKIGIRKFLVLEKKRWTCSQCGNLICIHDKRCPLCGTGRIYYKYISS